MACTIGLRRATVYFFFAGTLALGGQLDEALEIHSRLREMQSRTNAEALNSCMPCYDTYECKHASFSDTAISCGPTREPAASVHETKRHETKRRPLSDSPLDQNMRRSMIAPGAPGRQSVESTTGDVQSDKSASKRAVSLARWSERALVDALILAGRGEDALALWIQGDAVSRIGGRVPRLKLGGRTLLRLLEAAGDPRIAASSPFLARRLYECRTEAEGVRRGVLPETLLIKAHANRGELEQALCVFNETLAAAAALAVDRAPASELSGLLNAALSACAACADPARAMHIFAEASLTRPSLLDDGSVRQMMLAYCSGLQLHSGFEALRALPRATDGQPRGGIEAVLILMNACATLQDATLALELLRWASLEDILGKAAVSLQTAIVCSFLDVLLPSDGRPPPVQLLELALVEYRRALDDKRVAPFVTFRIGRGLVEGLLRAARPALAFEFLHEARVGRRGRAQLLALSPRMERMLMRRFFDGTLPGLRQPDLAAAIAVVDEFKTQRLQPAWPPFKEHRGRFDYWNSMRERHLKEVSILGGSHGTKLSQRAQHGEATAMADQRRIRRSILFGAAANVLGVVSSPSSEMQSASSFVRGRMVAPVAATPIAGSGQPNKSASKCVGAAPICATHWQAHQAAIRYAYDVTG